MKHAVLIVFLGMLLGWSAGAHAQETKLRIRSVRPVELSLVAQGLAVLMIDGAGVYGLHGGYNLTSWLAAEAHVFTNGTATDMAAGLKLYMLPFKVSPYLKVEAGTILISGEGVGFGFNPGSALGLEFASKTGFTIYADAGAYWWLEEGKDNQPFPEVYKISLGLGYRF